MRSHAITKLLFDPNVSGNQVDEESSGHSGREMRMRYSKLLLDKKQVATDALCRNLMGIESPTNPRAGSPPAPGAQIPTGSIPLANDLLIPLLRGLLEQRDSMAADSGETLFFEKPKPAAASGSKIIAFRQMSQRGNDYRKGYVQH
jgi:hypothetical protein